MVYGAVAAFKVVDDAKAGKPTLIPGWISRDMYMADPPVIANGVVYAYGSGESTTQRWAEPGHVGGRAGRIQESTHAVLYALDGETGEELWSSGDQITSWNHFSGLSRRQRPRLHRHVRRHAVLLRRGESSGSHVHVTRRRWRHETSVR